MLSSIAGMFRRRHMLVESEHAAHLALGHLQLLQRLAHHTRQLAAGHGAMQLPRWRHRKWIWRTRLSSCLQCGVKLCSVSQLRAALAGHTGWEQVSISSIR
jgi:hypothetical protein